MGLYLSLFFHNSIQAKDVSSCCSKIRIESNGEAIDHQSNRVGDYSLQGVLSDRPVYKNIDRDEFLFYLQSRNKGLWMVGPKVAQFNGGLAHRGDAQCVEDVEEGQWKYTDGSAWHVDPELAVNCLDVKQAPECTYSDGVEFVGGDLATEFGGGGIQTNMNSSAECIEECEKRSGCQYWSWVQSAGINCFLKVNKVESVRTPKFVSGSIPSACINGKPEESSVCNYEGIDFLGGDLFSVAASGLDDCRQQCEDQISCKLFSFFPEDEIGCYLKSEAVKANVNAEVTSGAISEICKEFVLPHLPEELESNEVFNSNEIHGQFKIMMDFREEFNNPETEEFKDLSAALERYLLNMLESEPELNEQATFDVRVESYRPGSVICNFKVNYVLKEAYLAIPFAIKPSNITSTMNKNFKFKKGILFQRFLIAAGSFKSSSPVDHCEAKGCSHKCNYDYDVESYLCTCPPSMVLNLDEKTCVNPDEVDEPTEESSKEPEVTVTLLPSDCLWSAWSEWSPCDCSTGRSNRNRSITIPAKNGGLCSGRYKEVLDCEAASCVKATETTTLNPLDIEILYDDADATEQVETEATEQPETEVESAATEQPEAQDGSEAAEQQTEDGTSATEQPETEDETAATEQPETEDESAATEQPETEDGSAATEQPETEDGTAATEQPETEDGSTSTELPETKEGTKATEQPETEDGSATTEQPETEDGSATTEQPETEDGSATTEQPETQDGSVATKQPETGDGSAVTEQPEPEDGSAATQQPETENGSEATEQIDAAGESEATEQPETSDESEATEQLDAAQPSEATDQIDAADATTEQKTGDDGTEVATEQPTAEDDGAATTEGSTEAVTFEGADGEFGQKVTSAPEVRKN